VYTLNAVVRIEHLGVIPCSIILIEMKMRTMLTQNALYVVDVLIIMCIVFTLVVPVIIIGMKRRNK
jgi:hypothetical protein